MFAIATPTLELDSVVNAKKTLQKHAGSVLISGCVDSQKWNVAYALGTDFTNRIIVTYSDQRVREIYEDYRIYDKNVRMYPAKDVIFYQADVHGNKIVRDRLLCLKRMIMGLPTTLVTTFSGLMNVNSELSLLKESVLNISMNASVMEEAIIKKLVALGYERTYQVETQGQFSVRGGIVDIFDLTEDNPYRIELWGDEVTGIRSFDVESQRSVDRLESITIYPATELPLSNRVLLDGLALMEKEAKSKAADFRKKGMPEEAHRMETMIAEVAEEIHDFPYAFNADGCIRYFCDNPVSLTDMFENALFVLDEPMRLKEHADAVELEFNESMKMRLEKGYILKGQADVLFSVNEVLAKLSNKNVLMLAAIESKKAWLEADLKVFVNAHSIPSYNSDFSLLVKDLKNYKKRGYRVLILSGSHTRAKRLSDDLTDNEVPTFFSENKNRELAPGEVMTMYGYINRGFEYPELKYVVLTESDIFGVETKKKKKKKRYDGQKIQDFNELHVGDYVVHENHGVGIYQGIEKVEVGGIAKDYMKVTYKDGGALYVPATNLSGLMKYASADAKKPKLNKLGSQEWHKTTTRVKQAVEEIATELVDLYAARSAKAGYVFSEDTLWQKEFEETFPYEETEDQLDAIEATKKDMESSKIMDRLICGDVGFGKTEIAIRAAFKAVQDGKQVAFLVPTTILAQQHFNTFKERMKDYPVRVDLMSRFVTKAEQKKTLTDLKQGLVDIVIGTHRLLSDDICFKDLGLLIVDEEQRFGVTHKEKIKHMKENVDVLTLTATPIPRTLNMSLVGIRDMSVLEEAPNERMPIQTYIMEYDEEMVREAIHRELGRNGQVYFVYNRVNNIADIAASVQKLVPEANVAFAHGQMKESELERIMYDFISGEIDVLVATTIIETGIDIPNVNTMIIHDADNMGLSQLYQLRGRVGRSNRTSYAFLMYRRDKMLKEVAEKRLQTIRDFTDLGSGFKIAMRDMEIRGAGNILGMSQSGHMEAVGYDLYCKLLNKAVMRKKGIVEQEEIVSTIDMDIDAYIPSEYILNEIQKLDTYKRIASLEKEEDIPDMREELKDRFGDLPESVENLLVVSDFRIRATKLFISEIVGRTGEICFTFLPGAQIRVENIDAMLRRHQKKLTLSMQGTPTFTYRYYPKGEVKADERLLRENTYLILNDMRAYLEKEQ